jgi:hypothetical protein
MTPPPLARIASTVPATAACDARAAVSAAGEDAAYLPIGQSLQLLVVGGGLMFGSSTASRTGTSRRGLTGIHQSLMHSAVRDVAAFAWRLPSGCDRCRRPGWNPMHQQPPQTPLLASTRLAKSSHVAAVSGLVVYVGTSVATHEA